MSLSQLFSKPLDPIPAREELWASTRPTYRFDVVETSTAESPSKSESESAVSPALNVCSPKEEENDHRKSVLYSARRRPTVQEFLHTNYHRHPKFCLQAAGFSETRHQLLLRTQRIIPLKKDNQNNFIENKQVSKVSQQSYSTTHGKDLNSIKITQTGSLSISGSTKAGTKEVSGVERIGLLGFAAASASPKEVVKGCSSNKDLSKPRFKTIVKNGSMVTIRLPPLKPKENIKKDGQSQAVSAMETVSTERISGALLPQRNDKEDLIKISSPSKSSDHDMCCEDNATSDCGQTKVDKVGTCSVEKLKEVLDVPTRKTDREVTLTINDNKPVETKAAGDASLADETDFLNFLETEPKSFATGTSKSVGRSLVTGKPDLKQEEHMAVSKECSGLKRSDLHLPVATTNNSKSNHEEETIAEKNISFIESGSQITDPNHSPRKSHESASKVNISEQQTQLSVSGDDLFTTVLEEETNTTAQALNNHSSIVGCQLKCEVKQSNKSDNFVSSSSVVTKQALDNVLSSSPTLQVTDRSDLAEIKTITNHGQSPKQTEQKSDENCTESNISPKEGQTDDQMNSQNPNKQDLDGESESEESLAELVFASSDSNFEEEEEEIEEFKRDEQCKDFPSYSTDDNTPGPELAKRPRLSDVECEEGEILSSSDDELMQSESNLAAHQLNQNSDPRGTFSATDKEKPMKTRSTLRNVKNKKKKKKIASRKKGIQMAKQGTRNAKNSPRAMPEKRKQVFAHQELARKGKIVGINNTGAVTNFVGDGPAATYSFKATKKEPSLLDSIAGAVVDVTIAADEKLVKRKPRGGSKEAQKLKKKMYKQKKRRLQGYKPPEKPRVRYEPLPPPVCKYYLMGICKMGAECSYRHEGEVVPIKKKGVCKFYTTDCCTKGDNCPFMHSDFPCMFFHTNRKCYRGNNCKYSHDPLTEEMKEVLEKYIQENQQREEENQTAAAEQTQHYSHMEESPGTHHGMVLRSRPHPTDNNTDSINTRYTPCYTPGAEEVPGNGSHGSSRENSIGCSEDEAAEVVQRSPYNLRLRERKRKTSEDSERGMGSQTPKAAKKDESASEKEHCIATGFFPGMYREVSN